MAEALLAVERLAAGYGDIRVLWDVSLDVRKGEIACLVGSNGAGKSTLLRCISGMMPAEAGTLRWMSEDITGAKPDRVLAAGLAHVPEGRRLFAGMSVQDNLLMGAYLRGNRQTEVRADLEMVYGIFPRLAERRRQDASTLSGGEQQMCAIGRGLMSRPKLLMIDELSLGLAPRAVEQLAEALVRVNGGGVSILLVEQDVTTAFDLAHRGFVLDSGRIVLAGTSAELAGNPLVREAYMGLA